MADFVEIPILKAGTYKGLEIPYDELDIMAQSANICSTYIKELAERDPTIPSYINFNHSEILAETIKQATREVTPLFSTKVIDNEKWIVASLQNTPNDVAETIIKHFPYRSVEIIHQLHNPFDDKDYNNVIRSIGFLDKNTPPAVKGQSEQLSVIFNKEEDSPITVIHLEYQPEPEEKNHMAEIKEEQQMTIFKEEDVKALIEEQVKHKEEELKADFDMKVEQLSAEKQRLQDEIQENKRKAYEMDIAMFMEALETKHHITPAAMEIVKTMVEPLNYATVTKLSENETNPVDTLKHGIIKLAELAEKGTLILNDEQIVQPGQAKEPGTLQEQRAEAISAFMEQTGKNYSEAWNMAAKAEETKHLFVPQLMEK